MLKNHQIHRCYVIQSCFARVGLLLEINLFFQSSRELASPGVFQNSMEVAWDVDGVGQFSLF